MPEAHTGDKTVNVSCKSGISAAVRPGNFRKGLFPVKDDLDLDARRMGVGVENLRRAEGPQGEEDEEEEDEDGGEKEATGKQNSFGQEKIREAAILECQRRLIPYVLVPSYNTTAYCPKCGSAGKYKHERCKKLNTYTCKCCGYTNANADFHAAQNHAIFGEYLFKYSLMKF